MNSKIKFIAKLAAETGQTKKAAAETLNSFSALLKEHLLTEGQLVLPGLGKLVTKDRPARQGRNPRTGESIEIDAKTVVKFRPSPKLF